MRNTKWTCDLRISQGLVPESVRWGQGTFIIRVDDPSNAVIRRVGTCVLVRLWVLLVFFLPHAVR